MSEAGGPAAGHNHGYGRRRFLKLSALAALAAASTGTVQASQPIAGPSLSGLSQTLTISKSDYYDKTLACILGQVTGVLTGYEFYSAQPVPDDWFIWVGGPYAGNNPNWQPNSPNYNLFLGNGRIASDDDWHIDFFNQLIMSDHGWRPNFQDIKDEWLYHQVSDWGGGFEAMRLMRDEDMLPPATGLGEFNRWYWVTEAYIETETIGCVAPGMPATARDLDERFASVVAEWEAVWWAKFLATTYSFAYFETDARTAMDRASAVLPRNSWNWQIYQKAVSLHNQNSTNWRWAQSEMLGFKRRLSQSDNVLVNPDINNGSFAISILYGNNDYNQTARISALIGNDADCTASAAIGLMGIIKGTSALPQEVRDKVYANGSGVAVNKLANDPHITNDYPAEQLFTDLARLYQRNAEAVITANGGSIDSNNYYINAQDVSPEQVVLIDNYDFEQGNLNGWGVWPPGSSHAFAENNGTAHSGDYKGTVYTDNSTNEVYLYRDLSGLDNGATYRVYAFIQGNQEARLYADKYGTGGYIYANVIDSYDSTNREWVSRTLEFTVSGSTAVVGLHLPPGPTGWACIDNLYVQKITNPSKSRYEAESAQLGSCVVRSSSSASNGNYVGGLNDIGGYVQFGVNVPSAGEYRLAVNYANGWSSAGKLNLYVNGNKKAAITFPRTNAWGTFSRNIVYAPVVLNGGANTIKLQKDGDTGYVELDYIELSAYPTAVY